MSELRRSTSYIATSATLYGSISTISTWRLPVSVGNSTVWPGFLPTNACPMAVW